MSKKISFAKKAIVIFGYPGSGKSTQATLLAEKFGLYHFNTGRFVENLVHNPALANHPDIKREKKLFDTGKLMDSDFTLAHVSKRIKELAKGGESIIFSGSPRTVLEAFGSKKNRGLVAVLQELYDKNSIIFIVLKITKEQALARNSKRLICSVCQTPLLGNAIPSSLKSCPFCGGSLYRRTLDDPKTILIRFKEYEEKTVPIIKKLQERKMIVHTVSASAMPNIIFKRISKLIV